MVQHRLCLCETCHTSDNQSGTSLEENIPDSCRQWLLRVLGLFLTGEKEETRVARHGTALEVGSMLKAVVTHLLAV